MKGISEARSDIKEAARCQRRKKSTDDGGRNLHTEAPTTLELIQQATLAPSSRVTLYVVAALKQPQRASSKAHSLSFTFFDFCNKVYSCNHNTVCMPT